MSQAARRGESQGLTLSAVHGDPVRLVSEQLWGELIQVVSPVGPSVTTGGFLIHHVEIVLLQRRHSRPGGFDQKVVFACAEPEEFQSFLEFGVVQGITLLFFPGWPRAATGWTEYARTEHADIGELVQFGDRDV